VRWLGRHVGRVVLGAVSTTMAYSTNTIGVADPFLHLLDAILADIAIAVQLPPGLHAKTCDRYEAVRDYAERESSPLRGRIVRFYPQGSMAIDATTSIRGTDHEFDLDIVAALDIEPDAPPAEVLDLLYESVEDYPTSQKVERQTRCITIRYADRMHLDITPAARLPNGAERESHIFHAHPNDPARLHCPRGRVGTCEAPWGGSRNAPGLAEGAIWQPRRLHSHSQFQ
jgi:hypothetical protein